ncbi:MAG: Gfo/Idh/MocA family oxidoreductase [Planctomycetes bacterium]|nr:Gfo/Idh/MocA family oxidoreductase [Planctomycetota bacterium]
MVGVGVIGAGHWGPNLIRNVNGISGLRLVAVADQQKARLDRLRPMYPGVNFTEDASALFSNPEIGAILIATPVGTHFKLATAALQAGKHVFVEKPLTDATDTAAALAALAAKHGKVLMTGHVFVYNFAVVAAKRYIDTDHLGKVCAITAVRTNLGRFQQDVDVTWDLACHDIAIGNYLLDSAPVTASAVGGSFVNPGHFDTVYTTLRYPGGQLLNINVSWLHPRKAREMVIVGAKRMLYFDDTNPGEPIRIYDKGMQEEPGAAPELFNFGTFKSAVREGDVLIPRTPASEPLRDELQHFHDCIEKGIPCRSGPRQALEVIATLEAMARSAKSGGRQEAVTTKVAT